MGFLATDVTPISSTGPTTNIPVGKDRLSKVFKVSRTDTASVLEVVLPGDASIEGIVFNGTTTSNAQTTASISITVANDSGTIGTGSVNVKSVTTTGFVTLSGIPNIQPVPLTGDIKVTAVYAETGTASATGGPWYFTVNYVR